MMTATIHKLSYETQVELIAETVSDGFLSRVCQILRKLHKAAAMWTRCCWDVVFALGLGHRAAMRVTEPNTCHSC
jgi:hypothetical protein